MKFVTTWINNALFCSQLINCLNIVNIINTEDEKYLLYFIKNTSKCYYTIVLGAL